MISEVEKGGLNMLDIDSMVRTRRVICIKKYLEDYKSPWKAFLNEFLIPVGGKVILHCNFDTSKLRIYLPSFYKQCLDAWSEVNAKTPSLLHEIANEVIWNNKLLCINKKSVYRRDIADLGFLRAPVCKNQTISKFRGKSRKFDFFHSLMLERLGYN